MAVDPPTPPVDLPASVIDPIARQDPATLEALGASVDDLLAHHRAVENQDLESGCCLSLIQVDRASVPLCAIDRNRSPQAVADAEPSSRHLLFVPAVCDVGRVRTALLASALLCDSMTVLRKDVGIAAEDDGCDVALGAAVTVGRAPTTSRTASGYPSPGDDGDGGVVLAVDRMTGRRSQAVPMDDATHAAEDSAAARWLVSRGRRPRAAGGAERPAECMLRVEPSGSRRPQSQSGTIDEP